MLITFPMNNKELTGRLKYYYNGCFTVKTYEGIFEVAEEDVDICNKEGSFVVETKGTLGMYITNNFDLARAFADGYNMCLETHEPDKIAVVKLY